MNPNTIAAYINSAIVVLYNSRISTFVEIFGAEDAAYLWNKFTIEKKGNEGDFICYLDFNNQKKLAAYVIEYAKKNDNRIKES